MLIRCFWPVFAIYYATLLSSSSLSLTRQPHPTQYPNLDTMPPSVSSNGDERRSPSWKRGQPDTTRQQPIQQQREGDPIEHSLPWTSGGRAPAEVARAERRLRRGTCGTDTAHGGHRVGRVLEGSHQQCQRGAVHNVFPRWLLHEVDFRQLGHAELATLRTRREEAADWIKQEVRCVALCKKTGGIDLQRQYPGVNNTSS